MGEHREIRETQERELMKPKAWNRRKETTEREALCKEIAVLLTKNLDHLKWTEGRLGSSFA